MQAVGGLKSLSSLDTPISLLLKSSRGAIQNQRLVRPYEVSNMKPQLKIHLATSQPHVALRAFELLHNPAQHLSQCYQVDGVLPRCSRKLLDKPKTPHIDGCMTADAL